MLALQDKKLNFPIIFFRHYSPLSRARRQRTSPHDAVEWDFTRLGFCVLILSQSSQIFSQVWQKWARAKSRAMQFTKLQFFNWKQQTKTPLLPNCQLLNGYFWIILQVIFTIDQLLGLPYFLIEFPPKLFFSNFSCMFQNPNTFFQFEF